MKKMLQSVLLITFAIALSSCASVEKKYGFFHNNSNDYRQAKVTQPLSMPPGYSSTKFTSYYPVPNPSQASVISPINAFPPDVNLKKVPAVVHFWQRYPWF